MPPRKDKLKDPNKPKGRISAYAFFVKHKRLEYKSQGKEVDFSDFSKDCSCTWKKLDDSKKTNFFKSADEDRRRYDKEMSTYVAPDGASGKKRRVKKVKDPNQPKRAMSAFMWFAKDMRPRIKEEHPGATVGETAKYLGAEWREMNDEQKSPYVDQQKEDRARYEIDITAYRKGLAAGADEEEEEEEEEYSDED